MWSQIYVLQQSSYNSSQRSLSSHLLWSVWCDVWVWGQMWMLGYLSHSSSTLLTGYLLLFWSHILTFIKSVPSVFFLKIYNTKTFRYFIYRDLNNLCKHFLWNQNNNQGRAVRRLEVCWSFPAWKVRSDVDCCNITTF